MYEEDKLESILEEYKDMVRVKAGLYFMLGAEKDDLIQEGMIALVKAYNTYDPEKGASFRTYAELCVNRQLISAVKSASRQKYAALNGAVSLDGPAGESEDSPSLGETLSAGYDSDPEKQLLYSELQEVLTSPDESYFSSFERDVLMLLLEGLKYTEIADRLGKTPKQTDNAIQRIRKKIIALIEWG